MDRGSRRASRLAPERVEKALADGAETIFVWGGDGMMQRAVDAMAGRMRGSRSSLREPPNLFASNLGIPDDIKKARPGGALRPRASARSRQDERRALRRHGGRGSPERASPATSTVGRRTARTPRVHLGRAEKNLRVEPFKARIEVNGDLWYDDEASCLLVGNVGALFGGLEAFGVRPRGRPARARRDACREPRPVGANHRAYGDRLGRELPFVQATKAQRIDVELKPCLYESTVGRKEVKRLKVKVKPGALHRHGSGKKDA